MSDSILNSIKKLLGIDVDYTAFDQDIIIHINSALMTLTQLGIGPVDGYSISNDVSTWPQFIGVYTDLNAVRTYVYLKVRLVFDPPATSFVIASIEKQIQELEWRLNVQAERPVVADVIVDDLWGD